jgi:hypothetical protein
MIDINKSFQVRSPSGRDGIGKIGSLRTTRRASLAGGDVVAELGCRFFTQMDERM